MNTSSTPLIYTRVAKRTLSYVFSPVKYSIAWDRVACNFQMYGYDGTTQRCYVVRSIISNCASCKSYIALAKIISILTLVFCSGGKLFKVGLIALPPLLHKRLDLYHSYQGSQWFSCRPREKRPPRPDSCERERQSRPGTTSGGGTPSYEPPGGGGERRGEHFIG